MDLLESAYGCYSVKNGGSTSAGGVFGFRVLEEAVNGGIDGRELKGVVDDGGSSP